jgi:hypothetical protein
MYIYWNAWILAKGAQGSTSFGSGGPSIQKQPVCDELTNLSLSSQCKKGYRKSLVDGRFR